MREILKWPTVDQVHLVDLDARVIDLAKTYLPLVQLNQGALLNPKVESEEANRLLDEGRLVWQAAENVPGALVRERMQVSTVQTSALDADGFLQETKEKRDLIIADFPHFNT